jgi:hypothetical protein
VSLFRQQPQDQPDDGKREPLPQRDPGATFRKPAAVTQKPRPVPPKQS